MTLEAPRSFPRAASLNASANADMKSAMDELVALARVMSDPLRVRILALLCGREVCVCDLCEVLDARQSTLSTHLAAIRRHGVATARRDGRWMHYSLAPEWESRVPGFLALLEARARAATWRTRDERRLLACIRTRQHAPCDNQQPVEMGSAKGRRRLHAP